MIREKTIAFIGPGVMAEAMIAGLIRQKVADPGMLVAAGPREKHLQFLKDRYGIAVEMDNAKAASGVDVVVLSVKPQRLKSVLDGMRGMIQPDALVLSIVAGAPIATIQSALLHSAVIRAMPNTPAQIGEGITVWTVAGSVTEDHRHIARQILGALGKEIFMEEEQYLDMATALSGTGPAYVFLFMEAMVDAGVHLGFPRRVAEQLVAQTVRGSVDFYTKAMDDIHLAHLRNQVTSPGGTSAEALYYLEKAGFRTAISRAIWAAYERSQQLGKNGENRSPEKNVENIK